MALTVADRESFRRRVLIFLGKNPSLHRADIVNHFSLEGYTRATIYNTLDKITSPQPIHDIKRSGRPTSWTSANKTKLKRLTNNRTGVSQRGLARKFQVNQSTISRQLAKMNINYRKREKTPKYTEKQKEKSKNLSRLLFNHLRNANCAVVMDDEKYFTYSGHQMPGTAGYYSNNKDTCPEKVRFAGQQKFPPKILVWAAILERGISQVLIRPQKSPAIDADIYIAECLEKRLLPFLHRYHGDFNYIFWPDLASAHYAKDTVTWMNENVNFVAKNINPPNIPQARPIENFWAVLAQKVYEKGWEATNQDQLVRRIKAKISEFDVSFYQTLMRGVNEKLRNIAEQGVFSYLSK